MNHEQRQTENMMLVALAKAFSEQATILTGSHKHQAKAVFNNAVNAVDLFIRLVESNLTEEQQEYLQGIGDLYHNINITIRTEAKKQTL